MTKILRLPKEVCTLFYRYFLSKSLISVIIIAFSVAPIIACDKTNRLDLSPREYLKLSEKLLYQDSDSCFQVLTDGIGLARCEENDNLIAEFHIALGSWYHMKSQPNTSMAHLDSAYDIFLDLDYQLGVADVLRNKGLNLSRVESKQAIEYLLKSKSIYENSGEIRMLNQINGNLGNIYYSMGAFDKAEEKYREVMKEFLEGSSTKTNDLAGAYFSLANTLKNKSEFDSAKVYYTKALRIFKENNVPLAVAFIYNNLGNLFESLDEPDSALSYLNLSLRLKEDIGNSRSIASTSKNIASLLRTQNKLQEAATYLEGGLKHALLSKDSFMLRDCYLEYASINQSLKDFEKSSDYYLEFIELDQRLAGKEKAKALSEIEEKYENEKNERRIIELELTNQRAQNERNLMLAGSAILVLLALFLGYQVRSRKRINKRLREKNEIISEALSDKKLLIQEIHHRVKNNLQTISSLLKIQSKGSSGSVKDAALSGQNRVKSMAIIHQLLYQTEDRNIQAREYLQRLVSSILDSFKGTKEDVILDLEVGDIILEIDTAISIGLIVNELVTNSLKYGLGSVTKPKLEVRLKEGEQSLELFIKDNGQGFPQDFSFDRNESFGLNLVSMMARKLEATLEVGSDEGAVIYLSIRNYSLAA